MASFLSFLFTKKPATDYIELMRSGAVIVDVRTPTEYSAGHISGSINIAIDKLSSNLKRLPKTDKPIITCCASGMRSAAAKKVLANQGYTQVFNGGSWNSLQQKIKG